MIVGIIRETYPGERRTALVPASVGSLTKAGLEVMLEPGAGADAGYPDAGYTEKGVKIASDRDEVFASADVILQVRTLGSNPESGRSDLDSLRQGQAVIGLAEPLLAHDETKALAEKGVSLFSMELMPRITRAQSMDVLSSMASIAGYKAALLAADTLPKMLPMMMTAAGTIRPAKVFVVGAGVAGLQAIATAKRLGAVVEAYDLRPAVKEQVESLGARFVEMGLSTADAEDKGGYAKAMDEEFYRRQREMMSEVIAESDAVITTAAVPGKPAPKLVTEDMVKAMAPGSVIVDLAAERGGNCDLTQPGETVTAHGVTIIGSTNLPSEVAYHASQMYARNVATFLLHLVKDGQLTIDTEDEITRETLVCRNGEIVHPRVREAMGLPVETATADESAERGS